MEHLDSVVCLLERRIEELRADCSAQRPPSCHEFPHNRVGARDAIVRLYEEAMAAARFDLQVLRG